MKQVQVLFCPKGRPTFDEERTFTRIPQRGETILHGDEDTRYVVVEIDWQLDGTAFVIAHSADRPRAQEALRG